MAQLEDSVTKGDEGKLLTLPEDVTIREITRKLPASVLLSIKKSRSTQNPKFISIGPKEFIRIWQQAESIYEVSEKTGISKDNLYARAKYYRRKGIDLKRHREYAIYDWTDLKECARKFHIDRPITCPCCQSQNTVVLESQVEIRQAIQRRRGCKDCNKRFNTYEIMDGEKLKEQEKQKIEWKRNTVLHQRWSAFADVWNSCNNLAEAAQKLKSTIPNLRRRYRNAIKRGIELKNLFPSPKVTIPKLSKNISRTAKDFIVAFGVTKLKG